MGTNVQYNSAVWLKNENVSLTFLALTCEKVQ